jgi:hypothetical protein
MKKGPGHAWIQVTLALAVLAALEAPPQCLLPGCC